MATFMFTLARPDAFGASVMAREFTRDLRRQGHDVVVAYGRLPPGGTVSDVLAQLVECGARLEPLPPLTPLRLPQIVRRLRRVIDRQGVDLVIAFQQRARVFAFLAAASRGRPAAVHFGGLPAFAGPRPLRSLKRRLHGLALRRWVSLVVCPTSAVQAAVRNTFDVTPGRVVVVPNGVDVAGVAARSVASRSSKPSGDRLLLCASRLVAAKGQDLLVKALDPLVAHERGWRLALAGAASSPKDSFESNLRSQVASGRLADRVDFLGWRDDIPELLGACDVFVHPSLVDGWPLAVCEAMAAGCPVIITDAGGTPPEFVEGVHGWIVPKGDVQALSAAIESALELSDDDLRAIGAAAAMYAAERLDIASCTRRVVEMMVALAAPGTDVEGEPT